MTREITFVRKLLATIVNITIEKEVEYLETELSLKKRTVTETHRIGEIFFSTDREFVYFPNPDHCIPLNIGELNTIQARMLEESRIKLNQK